MKEQRLVKQEIDTIKDIRDKVSKLTVKLGQLEVNKLILQENVDNNISEIDKVKADYKLIRTRETDFIKQLTATYGEHTFIDVDNETIILK